MIFTNKIKTLWMNEICSNLRKSKIKGEPTLSHCAWARTFDLVIRWQI
jgi:hypothetical protein